MSALPYTPSAAKTKAAILSSKAGSLVRDQRNGRIPEEEFIREYSKVLQAMPKALEDLLTEMEDLLTEIDAPRIQIPHETIHETKSCPRCGQLLYLTATWSRTPRWAHLNESEGCGYSEIASLADLERQPSDFGAIFK